MNEILFISIKKIEIEISKIYSYVIFKKHLTPIFVLFSSLFHLILFFALESKTQRSWIDRDLICQIREVCKDWIYEEVWVDTFQFHDHQRGGGGGLCLCQLFPENLLPVQNKTAHLSKFRLAVYTNCDPRHPIFWLLIYLLKKFKGIKDCILLVAYLKMDEGSCLFDSKWRENITTTT
jgi:hypothetical protein